MRRILARAGLFRTRTKSPRRTTRPSSGATWRLFRLSFAEALWLGWSDERARGFQSEDARLVRGSVRGGDPCAGARLACDCEQEGHAHPGADRLREDARR